MLCLNARAKINWTLDILGRRADGYHLMDMLLQSVSLCDTLWFQPWDRLELRGADGPAARAETVRDAFSAGGVPMDEQNLVCRAARALAERAGVNRGALITLRKRIPTGAGMGGGSADAAAALIGLNRLWGLGLSLEELCQIGLSVGADVPFMLTGGLARVGGIGERIRPLKPAPEIWLALTQPCDGLSTRQMFSAFDGLEPSALCRPQTELAQAALLNGDLAGLTGAMGNVLEAVSAQKRPAIAQAARLLQELGAARAMMTGSGSVVYGVFGSEAAARRAYRLGAEAGGRWEVCRTEAQGVWEDAAQTL